MSLVTNTVGEVSIVGNSPKLSPLTGWIDGRKRAKALKLNTSRDISIEDWRYNPYISRRLSKLCPKSL